ncbi:MAG TPA: group 1 truncated hemoglobin [Polyangiaceae bacterium]|nr:group 1 truncated hemoglobin [Polyangiaceae bacterium]
MTTRFEELGGEPALRRIVDRFVDRLFDDPMIGFFFARADRARVKDKEYEFAAGHLGAAVEYTGRPLQGAHRAHRIFDGQFSRRLKILDETLTEMNVPAAVRQHWIEHTQSLRQTLVAGPCNAEPGQDAKP